MNTPSFIRGDLADQLASMPMPVGMHPERVLAAQIVAAQGQHIVDTQKIEVDQRVLQIVARLSAADQVRNRLDAVAAHDGGRDTYRTGTAAHRVPLQQSVLAFDVFHVLAVGCHVDRNRREFPERIERLEHAAGPVALERRQQLDRETGPSLGGGLVVNVGYVHCFSLGYISIRCCGINTLIFSGSVPRRAAYEASCSESMRPTEKFRASGCPSISPQAASPGTIMYDSVIVMPVTVPTSISAKTSALSE